MKLHQRKHLLIRKKFNKKIQLIFKKKSSTLYSITILYASNKKFELLLQKIINTLKKSV